MIWLGMLWVLWAAVVVFGLWLIVDVVRGGPIVLPGLLLIAAVLLGMGISLLVDDDLDDP